MLHTEQTTAKHTAFAPTDCRKSPRFLHTKKTKPAYPFLRYSLCVGLPVQPPVNVGTRLLFQDRHGPCYSEVHDHPFSLTYIQKQNIFPRPLNKITL